jgi:hypothetical protein
VPSQLIRLLSRPAQMKRSQNVRNVADDEALALAHRGVSVELRTKDHWQITLGNKADHHLNKPRPSERKYPSVVFLLMAFRL